MHSLACSWHVEILLISQRGNTGNFWTCRGVFITDSVLSGNLLPLNLLGERQGIFAKNLMSFFSKLWIAILIKFSASTVNFFPRYGIFFSKFRFQRFEKIAVEKKSFMANNSKTERNFSILFGTSIVGLLHVCYYITNKKLGSSLIIFSLGYRC